MRFSRYSIRPIGKYLNHKEQFDFSPLLKQEVSLEELKELYEFKKEFLSNADIVNAERIINQQESNSYQKLFNQLKVL